MEGKEDYQVLSSSYLWFIGKRFYEAGNAWRVIFSEEHACHQMLLLFVCERGVRFYSIAGVALFESSRSVLVK